MEHGNAVVDVGGSQIFFPFRKGPLLGKL